MDAKLLRAVRKLTQFGNGRTWVGYLTPSEIVLLKESGGIANQPHCVVEAQRKKAKGDSNPTWFYFVPMGEVKRVLGELSREQQRDQKH